MDGTENPLALEKMPVEEVIELFYPDDHDFKVGGKKSILDPDKEYNDTADQNIEN